MSFKRTSCGTRSPYQSPSPPSSRRNLATSANNAPLHCQPSEDADYTVTDLLPNPVIRNSLALHAHPRQLTAPLAYNNVALLYPYDEVLAVTHPKYASPSYGSNNSGLLELNLHSDHSHLSATAEPTSCAEKQPDASLGRSRTEQTHVKRYDPVDWSSEEDVDSPGLGARPAGGDELTILRHNYNRLLENQQRFIISNAQLHNFQEELRGQVAAQAMELDEARSIIRSLELDKQQLGDEIESLQRTLGVLKDQMPLLASEDGQPWQQANNDKGNGTDEWTSSLKEELRQTMLLAMAQQQQLNGLHRVIKQQNETIRRLTSAMTSSDPKTSPQLPYQDGWSGFRKHSAVAPRPSSELNLRQNPEGSSVSAQERVKGRRSVDHWDPPAPEVRTGSVAVPLKDSFKKIFGSRNGTSPPKQKSSTTATAVGGPSSPLATVAKQQPKQPRPGSGAASNIDADRDREGAAVRAPVDMPSHIDLENAGFVLVNSSLADSRICPLCGVTFPSEGTSMERFVEHVSQCVPPAEHRQCPVCLARFEKTVTDRMIEMHVNEHFDEDRFLCLSPVENK